MKNEIKDVLASFAENLSLAILLYFSLQDSQRQVPYLINRSVFYCGLWNVGLNGNTIGGWCLIPVGDLMA